MQEGDFYLRENDKGGIYSLAGFAYQIKVFILNILQLKNGDVFEYETIDDIALTISEKDFDKYEEKECAEIYESVYKAWQAAFDIVKSGNVTDELVKQEVVDLLMKAKISEEKYLYYAGQ